MSDRIYCTLADVLQDLKHPGFEYPAEAIKKIRSASDWIERRLGNFIPYTETKRFDGTGKIHLWLNEPLLSETPTIVHDGTTLSATDYLLYPRDKHWENGPYSRATIDPDSTLAQWIKEEDAITIQGSWGKYSSSVDTGADVSSQNDSVLTIGVDNGGVVSPGMVLLVESEQELVEAYSGTGTDSNLNISGAHTSDDPTILLTGSSINSGEIIRVVNEQMYVHRMEGNTAIVTRGWNGTVRASIADAADVYVYRTFQVKRGVNGTTAAAHSAKDVERYLPPFDVIYLCQQMAVLMIRKAETGYAGKTVSLESEEVFYHQEFPKSVYKEIRRNYHIA